MTVRFSHLSARLSRHPEAGAFVGFAAVFLFFAATAPETFLSHNSISSILTSQAVPGIIAIGITLLMISGEFDLSVGSIMGVSSLVFLYAAVNGIHILLSALCGLAAGCAMGLGNGLLLVWTGIPSFIITLGTMLVYRAISLTAISGGRIIRYADYSRQDPMISLPPILLILLSVSLFALIAWSTYRPLVGRLRDLRSRPRPDTSLAAFCLSATNLAAAYLVFFCAAHLAPRLSEPVRFSFFYLLNGRLPSEWIAGNYRISILWWLFLSLLFGLILTRTRYGNAIFATGGNAEAARAQGVPIARIRIANFTLSGGLAALAGIVQVARLKSVDPLRGDGLELEVIAAVVIGGTLLSGGYGSIAGSCIGTALTGMLRTGLVLLSVPANAFRGAIGALVILAVIINTVVRKRR